MSDHPYYEEDELMKLYAFIAFLCAISLGLTLTWVALPHSAVAAVRLAMRGLEVTGWASTLRQEQSLLLR